MSNTKTLQPRRPLLRRLLAWFGLAAALVSPVTGTVAANVDAERAALDARVQSVRDGLRYGAAGTPDGGNGSSEEHSPADTMAQWFNWPNWGNWNNWPNWGKWFNTR